MLRPPYPRYLLVVPLGGTQSWCRRDVEERYPSPFQKSNSDHPVCSRSLVWLSYCSSVHSRVRFRCNIFRTIFYGASTSRAPIQTSTRLWSLHWALNAGLEAIRRHMTSPKIPSVPCGNVSAFNFLKWMVCFAEANGRGAPRKLSRSGLNQGQVAVLTELERKCFN
jgi:hypothetical protein